MKSSRFICLIVQQVHQQYTIAEPFEYKAFNPQQNTTLNTPKWPKISHEKEKEKEAVPRLRIDHKFI